MEQIGQNEDGYAGRKNFDTLSDNHAEHGACSAKYIYLRHITP